MATGIEGRVAVITGAASGIGKATALGFAREGAKVVVVTRRSMAAAEQTVAELRALGGDAISLQCDVTSQPQVEKMIAEAVASFGAIDFAFNNAGVGPDGVTIPFRPLTDVSEADWDRVIDTNLKGVFLCSKHELRQMRKQGSGVIVNTSSTGGLRMMPTFGAYGPSKAGVVALTKLAAMENRGAGVRVNVVCPGPTQGTGLSDRLLSCPPEEAPPAPPGVSPEDVMGLPEDVAKAVIWLCSDSASHVNGVVLPVDGGLDII
ncbi:MAG: glucose 1-dehydrogenase [Actinobacteria bacterium]|nr:glucose 1-dehydrogenase [Actinomycetota bacterium]